MPGSFNNVFDEAIKIRNYIKSTFEESKSFLKIKQIRLSFHGKH